MRNLLPHFILENYKINKFKGSFPAFTLFCDISGFTELSDVLMQRGAQGVEILSEILQNTFNPTVNIIYKSGGFITNFSGDAFTALFKTPSGLKQESFIDFIMSCTTEVLSVIKERDTYETKFGNYKLKVRLGLSVGKVDWAIAGKNQQSFYFKGECIKSSNECEKRASENEIVIDEKIRNLLDLQYYNLKQINKEYYIVKSSRDIKNGSYKNKSDFNIPEITKEIFSKNFLPLSVIEYDGPGEFRSVASVFISFGGLNTKKKLDKFFDLLIESVNSYSGYLKEIEFGDKGDIVLCIFGAPVSHERDLERAVSFIMSIYKETSEDKLLQSLRLRTGITFGKVYAGIIGGEERCQYAVVGRSINLASRLMSKAGWGETWVSENIYLALKNEYVFEPLRMQFIKGFTEKIHAYKLQTLKVTSHSILTMGKMVGRQKELKRIREFVSSRIHSKTFGLIYIKGEAGIGKTRLINELKNKMTDNKTLKWYECPSKETLMQPLFPFIQLIRNYFNYSDNNPAEVNKINFLQKLDSLKNNIIESKSKAEHEKEEIIIELKRTYSVLGAMLNLFWEGSFYEKLDPKLRFENTIFSFYYFLRAECSLQPVVIEFEDAHWIDNQSLEMLNMLIRNLSDYPLVVVCSFRTSVNDKLSLIKNKGIPTIEVELSSLSSENTKKLTEDVLKCKISSVLTEFLVNKAGGNPLFISQLALDLKERELITRKNEIYELSTKEDFTIPMTINNVLMSRFDRLSVEVKDVIQIAAVLGKEFNVDLLSQIYGDGENLKNKIKIAEDSNIWSSIDESRYSFNHALLRDAINDMQLRSKVRVLHLKAADTILTMQKHNLNTKYLEEYSFHFGVGNEIINEQYRIIIDSLSLNNPGIKNSTQKFLDLQMELADHYESSYISSEALYKCNIILQLSELLNDNETSIDYKITKGNILMLLGRYDDAMTVFEEALKIAKQINNVSKIALSLLSLGSISERKGDYDSAMSYFEKSMQLYKKIDDKTGIAKTSTRIGIIYYYKGNYKEALINTNTAKNISEQVNDERSLSKAIGNIGNIFLQMGEYEKALKNYHKKIEIDKSLGDNRELSIALGNLGALYFEKGDHNKAMDCFLKKIKTCEELGDKREGLKAYNNLGAMYMDLGNFKMAMQTYEKMFRVCKELGDKNGLSGVMGNMGIVYFELGNYTEALKYLDEAIKIAEHAGIKPYSMECLFSKSEIFFLLSDYNRAKNYLLHGQSIAVELGDKAMIINYKILSAKIEFNISDKKKSIRKLTEMLSETSNEDESAKLHYTIFQLLDKDDAKILSREEVAQHRTRAFDLYKKMFAKTPRHLYKKSIEELRSFE